MQWETYLFELQSAVVWRMVMSRGPDERTQMQSMSYLLSTCEGMSNRELIDDGAAWVLLGTEQHQRPAEYAGQYASQDNLRWCDLVKQGLSDKNGTFAFERVRERFGKTPDAAKLTHVFQFRWTSRDSLGDNQLKGVKLMRQVSTTSLGDAAHETLSFACLEEAKERFL